MMNHVDLFTGIAGFSLAAQWVWGEDHNIILFCENDKFCQKRLRQLWPNVPIIEDITKLNGKEITQTIDLCSFGWPCQPYSVAGKRKGKEDDRYLWPEAYRVIQETDATWLIGENVPGIINMELDNVLSDLESIGYETQTFIIPACAVDARHRRDRIWIVAHSRRREQRECGNTDQMLDGWHSKKRSTDSFSRPSADVLNAKSGRPRGLRNKSKEERTQNSNELSGKPCSGISDASEQNDGRDSSEQMQRQIQQSGECDKSPDISDTEKERSQGLGTEGKQITETYGRKRLSMCDSSDRAIWPVEPDVGRVAHGIPNRAHRLKSLGNAIVPQVVEVIMRGIKEIELDR